MRGSSRLNILAGGVALFFTLICAVGARQDSILVNQIERSIRNVRRGETVDARAEAAIRLAELTRKTDPKQIGDKTFTKLLSLMDSQDDSVRCGVAAALGNLGARARPAVPKLLEILAKVDCLHGTITSADAIREALKRIGVKPPPRSPCTRVGA